MKHIKLYETFHQLPKGVEEIDYDEYNKITHAKDTRLPFSKEDMLEIKKLGRMFRFDPEPLGHGDLYFVISPTEITSKAMDGYFSNWGNEFYLLEINLGSEEWAHYKSDSLQQLIGQYMDFIGWQPEWAKVK